jgi:hypothetical protein
MALRTGPAVGLLVLGFGLLTGETLGRPAFGDQEKPKAPPAKKPEDAAVKDLNELALRVAALKTLSLFEPRAEQVGQLAKVMKKDSAVVRVRNAPKAGPRCRQYLALLYDALLDDDRDAVKFFSDKLDVLRSAENAELDDGIETTDAARALAPEVLRLFNTRQVAAYLGAYDESLPDPLERVLQTLDDGQELQGAEWENLRDDAATDVGWMVAGFAKERAVKVSAAARSVLDGAHSLKGEDLKKHRAELEQKIRQQVLGKVNPAEVLRHIVEHDLAELLSNPQLPEALQARLAKTQS